MSTAKIDTQSPASAAGQQRREGIANDMQQLMALLSEKAAYISRTLAWEQVAMGVAEIQELARCTSGLAQELQKSLGDRADLIEVGNGIKQMQTLLRTVAGSNLEVSYRVATAKIRVPLSKSALEQILINLISNSREAAASLVLVEVQLCMQPGPDSKRSDHGEWVSIAVSDNGILCPELAAKLRHARCFSHHAPPWFACGLSTVNQIITDAGGTFALAEDDKGGVIASVRLPAL